MIQKAACYCISEPHFMHQNSLAYTCGSNAPCILLRQSDIVECKGNHGNGCSLGIPDDLIITLARECLFPDLTFDMWLLLPFSFVLIIRKPPTLFEAELFGFQLVSTQLQFLCSVRSVSVLQFAGCRLIFELGCAGQGTFGRLLLTMRRDLQALHKLWLFFLPFIEATSHEPHSCCRRVAVVQATC